MLSIAGSCAHMKPCCMISKLRVPLKAYGKPTTQLRTSSHFHWLKTTYQNKYELFICRHVCFQDCAAWCHGKLSKWFFTVADLCRWHCSPHSFCVYACLCLCKLLTALKTTSSSESMFCITVSELKHGNCSNYRMCVLWSILDIPS